MFLEMYCNSAGSNLNAGTTTGAAVYTAVGDSNGTSVFTPSDGSTPASSINVGDYVSIYVTAGATVATFVARVTAVAAGVNGAVTVSTTAKVGTIPANSAGAHTITLKAGGAWAGPSGAVGFPFGFIGGTLTDAAGNTPRVNFQGTFLPTAAISHAVAGPLTFQGYTATPGDGGKATLDGGDPATSFLLFTLASGGNNITVEDLIFQKNGSTGSSSSGMVTNAASGNVFRRCVFNTSRAAGLIVGGGTAVECEAYGCNVGNFSNTGAFHLNNAASLCVRCYAHGNTTANGAGFVMPVSGSMMRGCIADGNTVGLSAFATGPAPILSCDFYNNTSHGIQFNGAATTVYVENSNFCNNGGWGIVSTTGVKNGYVINCAFGSGTAANALGQVSAMGSTAVIGSQTLPANLTPWNAPATGDFRVTLPSCKGQGRGSFTESAGKSGTIGFPDIGCAPQGGVVGGGPTAAQVATAVWQDLTAGTDFTVPGSIGALLVAGGSAPTAAVIASTVWKDLTAGADFAVAGSIGKFLSQASAGGFLKVDASSWAGTATALAITGFPKVDTTSWAGTTALLSASGYPKVDTISFANNLVQLSAGGLPGVDVLTVAGAAATPAATVPAVLANGVTHGGPTAIMQLQQVVVSNPSGDAVSLAAAAGHRDVNATTLNSIFAMVAGARSGIGTSTETYANHQGAPAVQMVFADTQGNTTSVTYLE